MHTQDTIFMAQWEKPERLLRAFAQYSLEMAHLSYGVDLSELIADGWCDACLLGGGRVLFSASAERASISRYKKLQDEMERRFRPKAGRAILATRMLPNGLGVVAISFTGTEMMSEWISNFQMAPQGGLHSGFAQHARQLEEASRSILLPELSRAMHLGMVYSLYDVCKAARRPGSPFKIWVSGHSRGGAVTQTFVARLMQMMGVRAENIIGVTFAAPTVADNRFTNRPQAYPVYHIINEDDPVTRMGCQMRLGTDLSYWPDEAFRRAYYKHYDACSRACLDMFAHVQKSTDFVEFLAAADQLLTPQLEHVRLPGKGELSQGQRRRLLKAKNALVRRLGPLQQAQQLYTEVMGEPVDQQRVQMYVDLLQQTLDVCQGWKAGAKNLMGVAYQAHRLGGEGDTTPSAYRAITHLYFDDLVPQVWQPGNPPRRRVTMALPPALVQTPAF